MQQDESLGPGRTAYHLDLVADPAPLHPGVEAVVVILPVGPHLAQPAAVLGRQPAEYPRSGRTVIGRRPRHQDHQEQSETVHDDVTLAPPQLLAAVVAPLAADFAALDRLAV